MRNAGSDVVAVYTSHITSMLVGELSIERAELVGQVIARAVTPQRVHKDLSYTADKL